MRPLKVTERVNGAFSEHAGCLERFLSLFTEATAFWGIWDNFLTSALTAVISIHYLGLMKWKKIEILNISCPSLI